MGKEIWIWTWRGTGKTKRRNGERFWPKVRKVINREEKMKIAISTDNENVSDHFGRCPEFTIAEIEENRLVKKETVPNPGHHPGFLPKFLHEKGVGCIIAGGMGHRAQDLFVAQGIETILGISGAIDEVIDKVLSGKLESGESLCKPGGGKGYGIDKTECDHPHEGDKK
jgi:predicted Fe-Mo cluster-binding NifX family protein